MALLTGLENASPQELLTLLTAAGLVSFTGGEEYCGPPQRFVDPAGKQVWSLSFVVADEDNTYVIDGGPGINKYV
jgi:hypothetical protein